MGQLIWFLQVNNIKYRFWIWREVKHIAGKFSVWKELTWILILKRKPETPILNNEENLTTVLVDTEEMLLILLHVIMLFW